LLRLLVIFFATLFICFANKKLFFRVAKKLQIKSIKDANFESKIQTKNLGQLKACSISITKKN
jgi:hypothetical protein